MRPVSLQLSPANTQPVASTPPTVRITRWTSNQRTVVVGSGAASWLLMDENANAGWQATLNGRRLTSTVLDGWKQAWLVPAGDGGVVTIAYAPDRPYRLVLLIGGLLALLGVGLALIPQRRRIVAAALPVGRVRHWLARAGLVAALAAAPLIVGWVGWACLAVAVVLLLAARGSAVGWPEWLGGAAAGAIFLAGLLAELHPSVAGGTHDTAVALQALCGFAVAALSISLLWREPQPTETRSAEALPPEPGAAADEAAGRRRMNRLRRSAGRSIT
jgi:arabinofuranan 3-O-arabinosyltransferase